VAEADAFAMGSSERIFSFKQSVENHNVGKPLARGLLIFGISHRRFNPDMRRGAGGEVHHPNKAGALSQKLRFLLTSPRVRSGNLTYLGSRERDERSGSAQERRRFQAPCPPAERSRAPPEKGAVRNPEGG
jgi:hypothetical protein